MWLPMVGGNHFAWPRFVTRVTCCAGAWPGTVLPVKAPSPKGGAVLFVLERRSVPTGSPEPKATAVITLEVQMAWIKRKIDASRGATDTTDFYAGGTVLVATMATVAALYWIGM